MSRLQQYRASPAGTNKPRIHAQTGRSPIWRTQPVVGGRPGERREEPAMVVKRPDPWKPSAKRMKRQRAAFRQWVDCISAQLGLGAAGTDKASAIVKQMFPKFSSLEY